MIIDTEQQLTIMVYHQYLGKHIIMTFVYAKYSSLDRLELWDNLYYLASDMELPWVLGGDFSVVLNEEDKIGGLPVYPPEYEDFASCIKSCGLFDMGYKGSPFTCGMRGQTQSASSKDWTEYLSTYHSRHYSLLQKLNTISKQAQTMPLY